MALRHLSSAGSVPQPQLSVYDPSRSGELIGVPAGLRSRGWFRVTSDQALSETHLAIYHSLDPDVSLSFLFNKSTTICVV